MYSYKLVSNDVFELQSPIKVLLVSFICMLFVVVLGFWYCCSIENTFSDELLQVCGRLYALSTLNSQRRIIDQSFFLDEESCYIFSFYFGEPRCPLVQITQEHWCGKWNLRQFCKLRGENFWPESAEMFSCFSQGVGIAESPPLTFKLAVLWCYLG